MSDKEGAEGAAKLVSMDVLKLIETSLRSSMEAQIESLKIMISDLMSPVPPVIEERDKGALEEGDSSVLPSSSKPFDSDHLDKNKTPNASPRATSVGASYNTVAPPFRSPDIPVPHPHINTRGDPPKFNDQDFSTWQFEFRSHVSVPPMNFGESSWKVTSLTTPTS
jgi:hypothetical protein